MENLAFMQPKTTASSSGHHTKHTHPTASSPSSASGEGSSGSHRSGTRSSKKHIASLGAIGAASTHDEATPQQQAQALPASNAEASRATGKRRTPSSSTADASADKASPLPTQTRRRSSRVSASATSNALEVASAESSSKRTRSGSSSRAGPRHSAASDVSSSASHRAYSPFSTPATPATSYSVSTSVSAASSRIGKSEASTAEAKPVAAENSGEARKSSADKGKAPARKTTANEPQVSPSSSRSSKRSRSVSATAKESASKRPKAAEPPSEPVKEYPLRSRGSTMAPKKQNNHSASSKSGTSSRPKTQPRRSKGEKDIPGPSRSPVASTSCGHDSDMQVDAEEEGDIDTSKEASNDVADEGVATTEDRPEGPGAEEEDDHDDDGEDEEAMDHDDEDEDDEDEQFEDEMDDPYGDEGAAGGFGSHLRAMAGFASGLSGRFRTLLNSLRDRKDPTSQMVALQELSEVLSISNEDTLAGYFPTESFVAELVYLMGGPKPKPPKVLGEPSRVKEEEMDDDEEVAFLTGLVDNTEMMLLACRCLANLIEAMPYAAHSVVSHGAVPVLNAKLVEIEFIDLAEQVLQTLEKISREYPSAIVNNGGLSAMLQYLDFFNIHVQRTALNAAAHCCRKLSPEAFDKVKDVIGIIQSVLSYSDQRLVESACRCIVRIIDSYRHHTDLLEQLLTSDVVAAVNRILLPASQTGSGNSGSKTNIGPATYAEVLKSLGTAARASPILAVTLLENNIVETLYHLLTGSPAPAEDGSGGRGPANKTDALDDKESMENNAGAAVAVVNQDGSDSIGMADVAVLQNLAQRPKDQVQEALSLVAELLPPLPRSGVFDPRRYTERAFSKRKAKQNKLGKETDKERDASAEPQAVEGSADKPNDVTSATATPSKPERVKTERELAKERAQAKRTETLQQRQELVKRFTQLVLPTLVEVYAASVAWHVRSKALFGILKIVSFVEPEPLCQALDTVPLASFVAGILSSRDHPMLVQGALQLVELLTSKLPDVYSALLRREGVMWEVEDIASRKPQGTDRKTTSSQKPAATDATSTSEFPTLQEIGRAFLAESAGSRALTSGSGDVSSVVPTLQRSSASASTGMTTISGHVVTAAEAEDSNIWRARILCDKLSPSASGSSAGGADEASRALAEIKGHVDKLVDEQSLDEDKARLTLQSVAELFNKTDNPISSFELLRSGLVNGLYTFAVQDSPALSNAKRRDILMQTLMEHNLGQGKTSAAEALVRRLQETLSRLENVEITTALSGSDEGSSRRSAAANVARQVRLKLVADSVQEGEIPRSCSNMVVSIHAITSFQSLHDYLRPKIAASQAFAGSSLSSSAPGSTSNLSGMLAAFASTAGLDIPESLRQKWASASEKLDAAASSSSKDKQTNGSKEGETSAAAGPSTTSDASGSKKSVEKPTRRRSSRLSARGEEGGKKVAESSSTTADAGASTSNAEPQGETEVETAEEEAAKDQDQANGIEAAHDEPDAKTDEQLARRLMEGLLQGQMEGFEDEEGYSDEYEEEFIDDEGLAALETGNSTSDQTIQLKIDKDGNTKSSDSAVEGAAPHSTLSKSAPSTNMSPKPPATPTGSGSYASALQKKPVDWHLQFEMDGKPVSLESTIYSAIHRHEQETHPPVNGQPHPSSRYVWSNTYTIKFRKVSGPAPSANEATKPIESHTSDESSRVDLPASLAEHKSWAQILQLLRVLYDLNREWRESLGSATDRSAGALSEANFVNNKITAKLNRQLEEPMIVASSCLPAWSLDMPRVFPFLFPFETRFTFLQSTSFGYNRLINKWQTQQSRNQDGGGSGSLSSRHDDSLAFLGRLTRQKVRISRSNILASAFKVFELYGSNPSLLEVEYFDEVGTGLGPTLEFYAMVSKEFGKKALNLWRSDEGREDGEYVYAPSGLFPAPMPQSEAESTAGKARLRAFKTLGQFVAKALYDSRIVDLNFSTVFMRAVLQERLPATLAVLQSVDAALAQSLLKLKAMPAEELESLSLDFTLPGQGSYELHEGGNNETVTADNVERYIQEVTEHTLSTGIAAQIAAFREGFDLIFPTSAMLPFTPEEMALLFGNQEEDWSEGTLLGAIKPDHGYNGDSATFRDVIALMSEFNVSERRDFLQWLTGSPKLPIGGFQGLHPQLTIVKRPPDNNVSADQTLPSVMTCVNFCKMPPFSSRAVMKERLLLAMREGQASFHLS